MIEELEFSIPQIARGSDINPDYLRRAYKNNVNFKRKNIKKIKDFFDKVHKKTSEVIND